MAARRVGIDVGGIFTDIVFLSPEKRGARLITAPQVFESNGGLDGT